MRYDLFIQRYDLPGLRAKAGDVIAIRPHRDAIGTKELRQFLMVTMDIADPRILDGLDMPNIDAKGQLVSKRRFQIPLTRLKDLMSSLDLSRVADSRDPYQPFVNIVGGNRALPVADIPVTGTIVDKEAVRG